jgi:hypothetical protein
MTAAGKASALRRVGLHSGRKVGGSVRRPKAAIGFGSARRDSTSVGTLTVAGDAVFGPGAVYQVENVRHGSVADVTATHRVRPLSATSGNFGCSAFMLFEAFPEERSR